MPRGDIFFRHKGAYLYRYHLQEKSSDFVEIKMRVENERRLCVAMHGYTRIKLIRERTITTD